MPDFYVEIKFDCESSFIPFFSKIATSDTFKIWKFKNHIRMDWNIISNFLKRCFIKLYV